MARTKFTEEQERAITADGNVIVSAGAGSGKTTVMIERIIRKLEAGEKLENMLIVTFTRASAADIKEKLVKKLNALKRSGSNAAHIARAALEAIPVSNIGTLHSFCQRLVKTYFYEAGFDPSATVCEDAEAKIYKSAAVRAAVDEALKSGDAYVRRLYDALCTRRDDSAFTDTVESAVDYALSTPDPDGYLNNVRDDADVLPEFEKIYGAKHAALTERIMRMTEWAHDIGATAHERCCAQLLEAVSDKLPIEAVKSIGGKKTGEIAVLNDEYLALKEDCKKFVCDCAAVKAAKTCDSAPYVRAFCKIACSAKEKYAAKKSLLGKLDYSDLEHGAKNVLSNEECKAELAQKIKLVFIDEFQDVNPLQAFIAGELEKLGAQMFLVGDAKQSIYGFRRCSPEHFVKKLAAAIDAGDHAALQSKPEGAYTKIILNKNFRSSNEVIGFVNNVFSGLMTEKYGGVDYESEKLIAGLGATGTAGFYYVNDKRADVVAADRAYSVVDANEKTEVNCEARYVTELILDYMSADKNRTYKDIAVLVRGMGTEFCADLKTLFERYGIPAHFGKNPRLSACPEAVALLDILRCVDNRYDDLALYTALRSPMGGFSDAELMEIARFGGAAVRRGISSSDKTPIYFWQKAEAYRGELKARLDAFYKLRDEFAVFALGRDAAETLGRITAEIGYFQYVYENFGGDAAANVQSLINAAADCDAHAFIKRCDDTDFELSAETGGDAVSVMTMHGSKGLEFELCIVADVAHKFNVSDATDRIIVSDGGIAVKVPDGSAKTLKPSLPWLLANRKLPERLKQEELRLLYVALTRAKKTLAVTCKNNAKTRSVSMLGFFGNVKNAVEAEPAELDEPVYAAEDIRSDDVERAVRAKCEFVYNNDDRPVKRSVTSLAESHGDDESAFVPVMFDGDDTAELDLNSDFDARSLGTLYHKAMELIDFEKPELSVLDGIEGMDRLDKSVVLRAAEKMRAVVAGSVRVFKERYFIADLPIDGRDTLVQGVIDLLALDGEGNATVVDYKTTKLNHLFTDGYKRQLGLYAAAVKKSTGINVKHTYLYSFVNNTLYEVELS